MKKILVLVALTVTSYGVYAQAVGIRPVAQLLDMLRDNTDDTLRLEILHELGKTYLYRRGELRSDLDSALGFFGEALRVSEQIGVDRGYGKYETLLRLGQTHFQRGDAAEGKRLFMMVIEAYTRDGDTSREARTWARLADVVNHNATPYGEIEQYYRKAIALYQESGDAEKTAQVYGELIALYVDISQIAAARDACARMEVIIRSNDLTGNHNLMGYLEHWKSALEQVNGDYSANLSHTIEFKRHAERAQMNPPAFNGAAACIKLADWYKETGDIEQGIQWFREGVRVAKKELHPNSEAHYAAYFEYVSSLACLLIMQGKLTEGYELLLNVEREFDLRTPIEKSWVAFGMAHYYDALGDVWRAEREYLAALRAYDNPGYIAKGFLFRDNVPRIRLAIGSFYVRQRKYDQAEAYLTEALSYENLSRADFTDLHLLLYKVDSAAQRYLPAMLHLKQHKNFSDQIFNLRRSKDLAELQVRFETDSKEQRIQLLSEQSKVQEAALQQAALIRNIIVAAVVVLIVIVGLLIHLYRVKQRSNQQLELQKGQISDQNHSLTRLVEEKQWLLKEVHHRVKNNMHMITSLLHSQSISLTDNAAQQAVKESQNRVYAMSMIHQKLYLGDTMSDVAASAYVTEFVGHLKRSFDTSHIRFQVAADPIRLDVHQAMSVGLILNEAITNAIKYAFPDRRPGTIDVVLRAEGEFVSLTVRDNGVGMPDYDAEAPSKSLGMTLMRGLSEEIEGRFVLDITTGVTISVSFPAEGVTRLNDGAISLQRSLGNRDAV